MILRRASKYPRTRGAARAAESWVRREATIAALEAEAERLAGKLDGQDSGARYRGRKLSDSGVKARFYHAVREAHLSHIVRVDLSAAALVYDIDSDALARWQGWAKAAKQKLDESMQEDAALRQAA